MTKLEMIVSTTSQGKSHDQLAQWTGTLEIWGPWLEDSPELNHKNLWSILKKSVHKQINPALWSTTSTDWQERDIQD